MLALGIIPQGDCVIYSYSVVAADDGFVHRAISAMSKITGFTAPRYSFVRYDTPSIRDSNIPSSLMMTDIIAIDLRWGTGDRFDVSKGGTNLHFNTMWNDSHARSPVMELIFDLKSRSKEVARTRKPLIAVYADEPEKGHFEPLWHWLMNGNAHLVYASRKEVEHLAHDAEDVFRPRHMRHINPGKHRPPPAPV